MDKLSRSDLPRFAEGRLSRQAACRLVYTHEEYAVIAAGHRAAEPTDLVHVFEERGRLYFVDRAESKLLFLATVEARGPWHLLSRIRLEDSSSSRGAYPGDIDVSRAVWAEIDRKLLKRFPESAWRAHAENFRVTPETDAPDVPPDARERALILAWRAFYRERALLMEDEPAPAPGGAPAARAPRLLAFIVDTTPFLAALIAARLNLPGSAATALLCVLAFWIYHAACLHYWGATVGKKLFGLRVVDARGQNPSFPRAAARTACYLVSSLPFNLGFLWSWIDDQGRAWHDYLSATRAVAARQWSPSAQRWQTISAWAAGGAFVFLWAFFTIGLPKYADLSMVAEAKNGLRQLGRLEELYFHKTGRYTTDVSELGNLTRDPAAFTASLQTLFGDQDLKIGLGAGWYRIEARARDSRRTPVSYDKPAPSP